MNDQDPLNFILDFRFTEIESELYAVEQHRRALETQLPTILENERTRIRKELLEEYGPEESKARYTEEGWEELGRSASGVFRAAAALNAYSNSTPSLLAARPRSRY